MDIMVPILYHGTDARLVKMSKEDREQYMRSCSIVIDTLWDLLEPLLQSEQKETIINGKPAFIWQEKIEQYKDVIIEKTNNPYGYYNVREAINCIGGKKSNNRLYEYGDLYLTKLRPIAADFARMSVCGGEYGKNAYRFIQAVESIGLEYYKDISDDIQRIKCFSEDLENHAPVVIEMANIDLKYLLTENGDTIDKLGSRFFHRTNYRYIKDIQLDLTNAYYLVKKE